jgi:hypothetical protein
MQNQIHRLRNLDLIHVLKRFQAVQDSTDPERWHTCQGSISVTGAKFMNWKAGIGGGGAIDLVMHLKNCNFKTAIAWLIDHFAALPQQQLPSMPSPRKHTLLLPPKDDRKLPQIINYLHCRRHIPLDIVSRLIRDCKLYADHRGNAVFPLLGKEERIVGAEIRGTSLSPWHGMARGSRKDIGCFFIKNPGAGDALICESAIDAISFFTMNPDWLAISTSGASPNPVWLPQLIAKGFNISCGYDADATGDTMAAKLLARYPAIKRLRPIKHDWNDMLIHMHKSLVAK